jgi:hypothetical protein
MRRLSADRDERSGEEPSHGASATETSSRIDRRGRRELRSLMAALFEEQIDTIECESAEAALATLLIGGREVATIFADVRLRGLPKARALSSRGTLRVFPIDGLDRFASTSSSPLQFMNART